MTEEQQFEEIIESDRQDFPTPSPAPDLEKLARKTAHHIKGLTGYCFEDELYKVILSILHDALRGKEAECQTCETLCQQCGVEHAAKIKGKDAEIARLATENKEMREACQLGLRSLGFYLDFYPNSNDYDGEGACRALHAALDKHGEAPPSPVAGQ